MPTTIASLNNLRKAVYLIICSRGPGTETITTTNPLVTDTSLAWPLNHELTLDEIAPFDPELTKGWCDESSELTDEQVQQRLNDGKLVVGTLDEGPVYLIPQQMNEVEFLRQMIALEEKMMEEGPSKYSSTLMSAMVRALIADLETWTSCNAWRSLEAELMPKEHLDLFMEVTGRKLNDLLTEPHCQVLRESAKLYHEGSSPTKMVGCL